MRLAIFQGRYPEAPGKGTAEGMDGLISQHIRNLSDAHAVLEQLGGPFKPAAGEILLERFPHVPAEQVGYVGIAVSKGFIPAGR